MMNATTRAQATVDFHIVRARAAMAAVTMNQLDSDLAIDRRDFVSSISGVIAADQAAKRYFSFVTAAFEAGRLVASAETGVAA